MGHWETTCSTRLARHMLAVTEVSRCRATTLAAAGLDDIQLVDGDARQLAEQGRRHIGDEDVADRRVLGVGDEDVDVTAVQERDDPTLEDPTGRGLAGHAGLDPVGSPQLDDGVGVRRSAGHDDDAGEP